VARVYTPDDLDGAAHDGAWFAATIIVREQDLLPAVDHLREAGGSGVSVLPLRYLFDARSNRDEAMLAALGIRDG
jgi:ATP phosphoribosyltransferase